MGHISTCLLSWRGAIGEVSATTLLPSPRTSVGLGALE